jgi:ribose transport system ATP-binding protein
LMGENGAGKSTLMKILSGAYTDYEGQIILNGERIHLRNPREAQQHGIAMIYQELNLVPELSIYENIFLGREHHHALGVLSRREMIESSRELLGRFNIEVDPRRAVRALRIGERQLVEIAKALSLKAQVLVMDEPTSALSEAETQRLFTVIRSLKAQGVAVIYISHRMDEIFSIADYVTVLRDGSSVISLPAAELTRADLIRYMVGRDINEAFRRISTPQQDTALEVHHLSLKQPGVRELHDISFKLRRGEILGMAGLMGAGRTETLETIFGVHPASHHKGEIIINGQSLTLESPADAMKAGLGYITEDRKGKSLVLGLPVRVNTTLAALRQYVRQFGRISRRAEINAVNAQVIDLGIRTPNIETLVSKLSGGNQQKVVLAKLLLIKPKVLLLDEPTRGIDVGAKSQVYELVGKLAQQGTAFVVASSEMLELLAICDRIIVLCEGRITAEFTREEATQEKILDAATKLTQ